MRMCNLFHSSFCLIHQTVPQKNSSVFLQIQHAQRAFILYKYRLLKQIKRPKTATIGSVLTTCTQKLIKSARLGQCRPPPHYALGMVSNKRRRCALYQGLLPTRYYRCVQFFAGFLSTFQIYCFTNCSCLLTISEQ